MGEKTRPVVLSQEWPFIVGPAGPIVVCLLILHGLGRCVGGMTWLSHPTLGEHPLEFVLALFIVWIISVICLLPAGIATALTPRILDLPRSVRPADIVRWPLVYLAPVLAAVVLVLLASAWVEHRWLCRKLFWNIWLEDRYAYYYASSILLHSGALIVNYWIILRASQSHLLERRRRLAAPAGSTQMA